MFEQERYLSLETFRRNGMGIRTPVWFAQGSSKTGAPVLYVYTLANAGKVKRIRRNGTVRIAACDLRGKVTGEWIDAHAELISGDAAALGMRLVDSKYRPWKQILDVLACFRPGRQRVMIAVTPAQFP